MYTYKAHTHTKHLQNTLTYKHVYLQNKYTYETSKPTKHVYLQNT